MGRVRCLNEALIEDERRGGGKVMCHGVEGVSSGLLTGGDWWPSAISEGVNESWMLIEDIL